MQNYVLFDLNILQFSIKSICPLATKVRVPLNQHDNPVITKFHSSEIFSN